MSKHFCKVGKIRPNLNKIFGLNALKEKAIQSFDVIHNKKYPKGFDVAT